MSDQPISIALRAKKAAETRARNKAAEEASNRALEAETRGNVII